jgi:hypothetical protein
MAVHDAKTTYGHCKNLIKLFETLIDPIFPIVGSVVLEEPRGTYASGNQMIPASYLRIHKPKSSGSHRFISRTAEASIVPTSHIIPQNKRWSTKKCLSFVCPCVLGSFRVVSGWHPCHPARLQLDVHVSLSQFSGLDTPRRTASLTISRRFLPDVPSTNFPAPLAPLVAQCLAIIWSRSF